MLNNEYLQSQSWRLAAETIFELARFSAAGRALHVAHLVRRVRPHCWRAMRGLLSEGERPCEG